jgi:hypothetical protein
MKFFKFEKLGGNSVFFKFFSWGCLFSGYKWMLISNLRDLGKRGKKKTLKNGAKTSRNLSKISQK